MLLIDRYLLIQFLKSFLIFFISFTGLFIVIDSFNNLDEFLKYGDQTGSTFGVLWDYYSPRVFTFFGMTSGILTLISAMFTVTWIQRHNEMTALMAAGISQARIVRPVIIAVIVIAILGVLNRELLIPQYMDRLTRNAQDWLGESKKTFQPKFDNRTGVLLNGAATVASDSRIESPNFRLDQNYEGIGNQINGENAYYQAATEDHPSGFLIDNLSKPASTEGVASVDFEGTPLVLMPADHNWLKSDQCFLATELTFEQLTASSQWRDYASTYDLIATLSNRSLDVGADVRTEIHSRIVQPFLDITLLFLGLPIVLRKENRNIFIAIGYCLLLVMCFYAVTLVCKAMGATSWIRPTSLAAFIPLIVFVPIATAMAAPLRD
ncbi:putative permease YjgP/YjgQ family protein [Bremerella volcania]|uniref:Putative permease YjgP/YjgQ family protein n=1 Tax=Bremerella volcania TaxID=2527984 RepID=A0A518CE87_9BACT|nr:LptF/LptG family permease [Bremerella volcania]QDU77540.1 putative permease YjgP/YjgQ family protein [Bremerella volcania]